MDLIKQYISQSITAAANNLRLNTQQIEVVALLRERILNSESVEADLKKMKKVTELSTLAIKLNEIYNFLTQKQIDLVKLSDKFKEHSHNIIKDLTKTLDLLTPAAFNKYFNNSIEDLSVETLKREETKEKISGEDIKIDFAKKKLSRLNSSESESGFDFSDNETAKENIIFEDEKPNEELSFQEYEELILKPIKQIDSLLKQVTVDEFDYNELTSFSKIMKQNADLSIKVGFDILANMHVIISKALELIRTRELMPGKEIIEAIRACLIVIVAVIKGKEVDITTYLNKAEKFGRKIQTLKIKD